MIDDVDFGRLLVDIDEPLEPDPAFGARLREELRDPIVTAAVSRRHDVTPLRRRPMIVVVAAAAAIAVVVGAIALLDPADDARVDVASPPPPTAAAAAWDATALRAACDAFNTTAFSPLDRSAVVGPANADHITTPEMLTPALERLGSSLETLESALSGLGATFSPAVTELSRARSAVEGLLRPPPDPVSLAGKLRDLRGVEEQLVAVQAHMVLVGVASCL